VNIVYVHIVWEAEKVDVNTPGHSVRPKSLARCSADLTMPLLIMVATLLFTLATTRNHYQTLGVPRDASAEVIKAAFKNTALRHHPDKLPRGASEAQRRESLAIFEKANAAFEVLGDPAQRRQYDFDLTNPARRQGAGGTPEGEPGAPPPRPSIEVHVECTLEQLGGFEEAVLPLSLWSRALGASVTAEIASRLQLPPRLFLPPGSTNGDRVSFLLPTLGPHGVNVVLILASRPHHRFERRYDALLTTRKLPAWYNLFAPPVRVRGIDGERVLVSPRGARLNKEESSRQTARTVRLAGHGLPVRGSGESLHMCERGELRVRLVVRTLWEELAVATCRLGAVACALVVGDIGRKAVPKALGSAHAVAMGCLLEVHAFLSNEVLGRASPVARMHRQRARAERRAAAERARSERDVRRGREARRRRYDALRARWWDPVCHRARQAWQWAWE
jgi:hypothetical protein